MPWLTAHHSVSNGLQKQYRKPDIWHGMMWRCDGTSLVCSLFYGVFSSRSLPTWLFFYLDAELTCDFLLSRRLRWHVSSATRIDGFLFLETAAFLFSLYALKGVSLPAAQEDVEPSSVQSRVPRNFFPGTPSFGKLHRIFIKYNTGGLWRVFVELLFSLANQVLTRRTNSCCGHESTSDSFKHQTRNFLT